MKKAATKKVTRLKSSSTKTPEKVKEEAIEKDEAEVLDVQSDPQVEPSDKKKEAISAVDNAIAQLEHDIPSENKASDSDGIPAQSSGDTEISLPPVPSEPEIDEFESKKPKLFSNPEEQLPEVEKTNKKLFLLGTIVFIITILVTAGVGFVILQSTGDTQKNEVKEESSQTVVPTVEPTVAVFNRDDWVFEVLNGSGKSGEAAKARAKLEALGYKVESVGNAKENVSSTQVFLPEGAPDTTELFNDLEKDFGKLTVTGELEAQSKVTIRIVLGSD